MPSSSCLDIPKSLIFITLFSPTRQLRAARSLGEMEVKRKKERKKERKEIKKERKKERKRGQEVGQTRR